MEVKHVKAVCDHCNKNFKLKGKMLKEKKVTDEVIKISFNCPKCGHTFVVGYKDKEINENIKLMNDINKEVIVKDKWEPMELESIRVRYNNLKERNLELNARYKAIYGG